ncbi:aldo/keto reductase [Bifidobacterium choloepi]|uniref:Aldo/keto reductase n=1 Tax=Bifidobacterium choloepi TaxID=2614131 RepID=A0A6I5N082_9BIFI|nr:aldo/keto reductase [Bifidobacterium choloepi]NEG69906.1 aldo/keto reductase [Bifidobacterium choloepi]
MSQYLAMSNGRQIPTVGLGTWLIDNREVGKVVRDAIDLGYRHIDTAEAYDNERGVGEGIKESGLERENIFVTTKVKAEYKTYDLAAEAIDKSLEDLQLDYVDLMLIHCPEPWDQFRGSQRFFQENQEVWRALEDAYKAGKVKGIGVANFLQDDLDNLMAGAEIKPMVNQILCHAGNTPLDLIDYCHDQGIVVEAYSPMGHGEVLNNDDLAAMAAKYNVSTADLCIQYDLQLGTIALPKARSTEHLRNNLKPWKEGFVISDDDMAYLKALKLNDYGESAQWPCYKGNDSRSR